MALDSGPLYDSDAPGIVCRKCKHRNPIHRMTCERCQARLPRPEDVRAPIRWQRKRPGYITGWAILFTAYIVLTLLDYGWAVAANPDFQQGDMILLGLVGLGFMVSLVVIAGVWQMHPWARIPATMLHLVLILFIILTLLFAPGPDTSDMTTEERDSVRQTQFLDICSGVFWIGFNAMYLVWFALNKEKFEPPA